MLRFWAAMVPGGAIVVEADYLLWKNHFGQAMARDSEVDLVPEPGTLLSALLAMTAVAHRVRGG